MLDQVGEGNFRDTLNVRLPAMLLYTVAINQDDG